MFLENVPLSNQGSKVQIMAKHDNCEISIDKRIYSKEQCAESGVCKENKDSTEPATASSAFPVALEVLARNRPILDVLSVTCLVIIVASIGVVVCLVVLYGKSHPKTSTGEIFIDDSPVRIVTRSEWHAQQPNEALDKLQRPVRKVIIAHTATEECNTQSECAAIVSSIQNFHMDYHHLSDIGFNFLVGADGKVYEGRGWNIQGAHTRGFNEDSICIAFIGTFTVEVAPEQQLQAVRQLISGGVKQGSVDPHYRLYGQRQLAPTESPGESVYQQIQTWPHWSNEFEPNRWV